MEIKSGVFGNKKLLLTFLMPSWLSATLAIVIGVGIVVMSIVLTHVGGTVQQSLVGLHNDYSSSSIGISVQTVAGNFAQNSYLNNVLLFLLWGSVGIVVYSIVRSIAKEFSDADELVHELNYVHANRRSLIVSASLRAIVRLLALVAWWVVFYLLTYKLIPYTIAASHVASLNLTNGEAWERCLAAAVGCMLCIQLLTILFRLVMLRLRVFGNPLLYS
jgi:hypothetical protein